MAQLASGLEYEAVGILHNFKYDPDAYFVFPLHRAEYTTYLPLLMRMKKGEQGVLIRRNPDWAQVQFDRAGVAKNFQVPASYLKTDKKLKEFTATEKTSELSHKPFMLYISFTQITAVEPLEYLTDTS